LWKTGNLSKVNKSVHQ